MASNKEIVKRLVRDAWTGKDVGLVDRFVSEDYVEYAPFGVLRGRSEYKEGITMFNTAFPDITIKVDEMVAEGDIVAFRVTVTGTHRGPFMDIPGTGRKVTFTGFDFTRLEGGMVVEEWFNLDMMGLMAQLHGDAIPAR